jgi:type III secretion system HrpE/YscL family protein
MPAPAPPQNKFRPQRKIVPLQEMEEIRDAALYLAEAKKLLEETRAKVDQMSADSQRSGLEEGLREAREQLIPELNRVVQEVRDSISMSENDLSDIVRNAVEMIIGELDDRERIYRILREALARMVDNTGLSLEVAPAELPLVREEAARLRLQGKAPSIRSIEADPLLRDGEIVVVTPQGRIHVGFRYQLDRLIESLGNGE